jgi:nitrate reductase NapA
MKLTLTRRDFIKSHAVAAAAIVAGISVPGLAAAAPAKNDGSTLSDCLSI